MKILDAAFAHPRGLLGQRVAGVDTSPLMLKQATRRNVHLIHRGRVQLQRASALALPFVNAAFDIALSANSVQLWPDQLAGVTEMRRVLKPGGQIAIILQPVWVRTNDEVKALGDKLKELLSRAGFCSIRCVFKQMRPIGSVCVLGRK